MKKRARAVFITHGVMAVLLVACLTRAESGDAATPPAAKPHRWLREISLLSGYGSASLDEKASNYEVIPLLLQFGFDINPLAERLIHVKPRGVLECVVEPFLNVVTNPDTNGEAGCSLLLKYSDRITSRIAPYIEGGVGMIYTTQHTHEQGTQCNFLCQGGAGLQFFINEKLALIGGYRYRHMSNAGIDDDNEGIDHHFVLLGVSCFFQ